MARIYCDTCQEHIDVDDYDGVLDSYECTNRSCPYNPYSDVFSNDLPDPSYEEEYDYFEDTFPDTEDYEEAE